MQEFVDYISRQFSIDNNTSATIILTLSIFIFGYLLNGINQLIVGLRTRRNYRNLFETILDSIIINLTGQADCFKKAAATMNINHPGDYQLNTVTITHLVNVDRVDFKMIYDAYFLGIENLFSKRKLKAFNKIFGRLSLVRSIENRLSIEVSNFITKFNEHENKFNESTEQIRQFYDNVHQRTDGRQFPIRIADYLTTVDRTIFSWQRQENREEYFIIHRELITPLLALNREHEDIVLTLSFNTLLLNASHHFDNMSKTLNVYNEVFNNHSQTYNSANKILNKSLIVLRYSSFTLTIVKIIRLSNKWTYLIRKKIKRLRKK